MEFYVLRPYGDQRFGTRFAFADILDPAIIGKQQEHGFCPCCGEGLGPLPWLPPHRIKLSNKRYPDFLWGAGFDLMVSDRFRRLYEAAKLTGITRFDPPAEIVRVGRRKLWEVHPRPPDYHNVVYLHAGADLDDEASEATRPPGKCPCCRQNIDGFERIVLRPGSWTGADLFEALGLPGQRLVTERFKQLVEEHGLLGVDVIPALQYRLNLEERLTRAFGPRAPEGEGGEMGRQT
jgi:hypothetical protein